MAAEKYYIGKEHWNGILSEWIEHYTVIAPIEAESGLFLQTIHEDEIPLIIYDQARAIQPLKSFLLPPLDEVVGNSAEAKNPFLFLGIKACDLNALKILDQAFGGDFSDPAYLKRREESIIIGADCTDPWSFCFCTLVGNQPYSTERFDLNLSKIWDGFVVEVGSTRGKALLESFDQSIKVIVKEEEEAQQKIRLETVSKVNKLNESMKFPESTKNLVSSQYESDKWAEHAKTCVECGACNHACPTCHCYFLDDVTRKSFIKLRGWDACMYSGYAVTAGGGTPRPQLVERFRNRYLCKFKYLDDNYGVSGCTGCGRCIEGCQGKIDMRSTLKDLSEQ